MRQTRAASLQNTTEVATMGKVWSQKLTWNKMWKINANRLKCAKASVYELLPSQSNLVTWKLIKDKACKQGRNRVTLEHILSSCPKEIACTRKVPMASWPGARDDYWRSKILGYENKSKTPTVIYTFLQSRQLTDQPEQRKNSATGILTMANDWIISRYRESSASPTNLLYQPATRRDTIFKSM